MARHSFHYAAVVLLLTVVGGGAVAQAAGDETSGAPEHRYRRDPVRIQPGVDLLLHAVTDDGYAIYQDEQTLYATKLAPGAPRLKVADVPGSNIAQPLQVGPVVFLWTDPDRTLPGFGVSPLVLWTARHGPQEISASSAVGVVATAASSDGTQVVFITNTTPDGLRGDIVHAKTRDVLNPTKLLEDIPLDFPFGQCRPLAGFARRGRRSIPVAAYCADGESTATLSVWKNGRRVDLIDDIATPMPFTLESNPRGTVFLVNLADDRVAEVTLFGHVKIVDEVASRRGFINRRGTSVYVAQGADGQGSELRLARRHGVQNVIGPVIGLYSGAYNRGGYYRSRIASPNGRFALFATVFDPATRLTDMNVLDVRTAEPFVLDPNPTHTVQNQIFTADSRYALYFQLDPTMGTGALRAGNRRGSRQISADNTAFDVLAGAGSVVLYQDTPTLNPEREFLLSTGDLHMADVADRQAKPRRIAEQAHFSPLMTADGRSVVFASPSEEDGPGLYLAKLRASSLRH